MSEFDIDPSEFYCADEDPMVELVEDMENLDALEEFMDFHECTATGHSEFWNDLSEINPDDVPF